MFRTRTGILVLVALFVFTASMPIASARRQPPPGLPLYIALGDSLAAGEGASDPATQGYVPQFGDELKTLLDCVPAKSDKAVDGCKHLQLINLGRSATDTLPGVTTEAVIDEQLPVALPEIGRRNGDANPNNDVQVITLDVGGNDVFGPVIAACLGGFSTECSETIATVFATVGANYEVILGSLREAAGPDATIIVMTYANPLGFCFLADVPGAILLGDVVLEGLGVLPFGLNDLIRDAAARHGVLVADTYGRLGAGDFDPDCLHRTDAGYDKMTDIFVEAAS